MADEFITFEGDTWLIAGKGTINDAGETYCHLSSTTRFRQQRNGKNPVQIGVFLKLPEAAPVASDWIEVSPDGGWTRYDVALNADGEGQHWVAVHKTRRDTLTEYTQTIKPGSRNWWMAVKLAHAAQGA